MRLFTAIVILLSFSAFGQNKYELWTEAGVDYKIRKGLHTNLELNSRFDNQGVKTFFPQLGLEYKLTKWLKPSVEYRLVIDRNGIGNYKAYNRLNLNANFDKDIDRLSLATRVRYQYAFNSLSNTQYNADFDMAIRIKPSVKYDINDFPLSPTISAEFFYNPLSGGPYQPGFDKVRLAVGADLDVKGPHGFDFKYQLDKKFHDYSAGLRHVLSLSYSYDLN